MKEIKPSTCTHNSSQGAFSKWAKLKTLKTSVVLALLSSATASLATDYVWKTNPSTFVIYGQQFATFEFPSNWTSSTPLLGPISSPDTNLIFNRCAKDGRDCIVTPLNLTANRQVGGLFFSGDSDLTIAKRLEISQGRG